MQLPSVVGVFEIQVNLREERGCWAERLFTAGFESAAHKSFRGIH